MTLVVDSSVAASWGMPDEHAPAAEEALTRATADSVIVPGIFWHELRNVFLVNERRQRLTPGETEVGMAVVMGFSAIVDDAGSHSAVLTLARRHALTAYDAAYLELALRHKAVLATLDNRLAKAALSENLSVISNLN